jgi:response regulator RpfG family c-di-GMP phosphodiesterase
MTAPEPHISSDRNAVASEQSGRLRILIMDDDESVCRSIGNYLRSVGYQVQAATSGSEALGLMAAESYACLIADIRMPGMSGLEVLPRARELDEDISMVVLTAVNDAPTARDALTFGAVDYLVKPIELPILRSVVEKALYQRRLSRERRNVERMIREEVVLRTHELEREQQALRALTVKLAQTLVNAMEAKDVFLRGHSQRVADMAASIAEEMELDEDTVESVRLAGHLHDVGKIGIRESVLNKVEPMTADEFEHIKDHVRIGMEILAPLVHIGVALNYVQDHHEHFNGSGYPNGRSGTSISIGGRILAAADAYDALTSSRAYRAPMTSSDTTEYLARDHVGSLLDPDVFEAMRRVVQRRRKLVFIDDFRA